METNQNNLKNEKEIVKELCEVIAKAKPNKNQIPNIISHFLYTIGTWLENCNSSALTSEEVLMRYAKDPTLGNALMAQGLHMKEVWTVHAERKEQKQ